MLRLVGLIWFGVHAGIHITSYISMLVPMPAVALLCGIDGASTTDLAMGPLNRLMTFCLSVLEMKRQHSIIGRTVLLIAVSLL